MKEPRNSGLCYAYATSHWTDTTSCNRWGPQALLGPGGKRLVLVSLKLITGPRLYQIAHIARFLRISE